jgi:hypothetical protein
VCRCVNPCWSGATDLRAVLKSGRARNPRRKTSTKLERVIEILEGRVKQTLLVCPVGTLQDVHEELQLQGVRVGLLEGAARQQEQTLLRWERGELSALLCSPCVLGVNLPAARRVMFLTTLIELNDFKQAAARVIRQGNSAAADDEEIEVIMLGAKNTVETRSPDVYRRFEEAVQHMSDGTVDPA